MEFKISTDLSTIPKRIEFNSAELKNWLSERLGHYKSLVITEEGIKDAKSDRAKLNTLREAMEQKRKDVKTSCLAPYNEFEKEYKSVLGMIDEPICAIDKQLSSFETARKESKRKEIEEMFSVSVPKELLDYLALPQIWNDRWLNKGYALDKIGSEIADAVEKTRVDLEAIRALNSDFETAALEEYSRSRNITASIGLISKLEERKKAEMEKKKAAALKSLESAFKPSVKSQQESASAKAEEVPCESTEQPQEAPEPAASAPPKLYQIDFRVIATQSQVKELKAFLKANNIQFMPVPKEEN